MEHLINLEKAPQLYRCNYTQNILGHSRFRLQWWSLLYFEYQATLELDTRHYQLQANTCILVPPNIQKTYHCKQTGRHYFAHFRMPTTRKQQHVFSIPECFPINNNLTSQLIQNFQRMIAQMQQQQNSIAETHLWHMLLCIAQDIGLAKERPLLHPAVQDAIHILQQQINNPPSLSDLAARVQISVNHLNKLFKEQLQETVHAYSTRLRMDHVQHLMSDSDMSIKDIAQQLGFSDLQSFNKLVRKQLGKSPRAIRKQAT